MQIKYVCDYCGNDFSTEEKCRQCEMSHLTDIEKLKYDIKYNNWYLMEENARINMINQDMWELYYSMVTEYNGEYEYYE